MGKLILLSSMFFCSTICSAQSGELDPTFGNHGIVKTDIGSPFNYSNIVKQVLTQSDGSIYLIFESQYLTLMTKKHPDGSTDISYGNNGYSMSVGIFDAHAALQTDGKIVVVGSAINSGVTHYHDTNLAMARFNSDGSLDDTFGSAGIQTTDFGSTTWGISVAIQSDGKIVLTFYTLTEPSTEFSFTTLIRLNTDGSWDNSFAEQTNSLGSGAITIQSDGKILLSGSALIRYDGNGGLDSSFNGDGYQPISVNAIAIQSDNKIVIGGYTFNDNNYVFTLNRLNSDGHLDSTFGLDGIQTTELGGTSIAVEMDGKITLAGGSDKSITISRYNPDGSLDNSFSGDGMKITDFGLSEDHVTFLVIQSDGKFVALGYTVNDLNNYIAVARYDSNGIADNSFNGGAILNDHITQGFTVYTSTAIQSDGKILAAGYAWNGSNYDFALARYNADGSLDNTFSGDGKQMTDFGSTDDEARAIVIQRDGKILLGGFAGGNFGLARYNRDGSLDISFDFDGMQTTDFGGSDKINSIAIQRDGKIVVAGSVLARYNTNGSLDTGFGGDGKVITYDNSSDIAIQNDGKIVIVGGDINVNVGRYNSNGTKDITFGDNGDRFIFEYMFVAGKSIAIQNDGKIIIGGYSEVGDRGVWSQFVLMRLKTDGSFDRTFNSEGIVFFSVNSLDYATSVLIQRDNKIILAGYSYDGIGDNFTIARFKTDGSLDNTFSSDGIAVTQASGASDRISCIAITNDKLYAVGNGQYPGYFGVVARYSLSKAGGKFSYNNVVAIKISTDNKLHIYPNPAKRILFVEANGNKENAIVQIVDAGGSKLKEVRVFLNGMTSFTVDVSSLPSGIYNLILNKTGKTEVQRFIKE